MPIDYSLLSSLAHPCIGAFIGYLTNKIAIRMLFRPLHPWYLFGCKLPMTPGVIPAKRHQLAVNMGEMVGRHLLTSKDIGAAISEEPFQEHLASLIDRKVREILKQNLGPLPSIVPQRFKAYFRVGVKTLKYQLGQGVGNYLASPAFEERISTAIVSRLDVLAGQELNSLVAPENRQSLYLFLNEVIRDVMQSDKAEHWLAEYLAGSLRRSAAEGRTIGEMMPEQLVALLKDLIRSQSASIMPRMGEQLSDPVLRAQVVKGILGGVDHFLDSLGPMGAMARGFLERDTFEPKVHAYLDEKKEDLIAWLQNPEVQDRMAVVLAGHVDGLLGKHLSEVLSGIEEERLAAGCRACATQLLAVFRSEGTMNGLSVLVHVGMEDLLDGGRRTLGDLAAGFFTEETGSKARDAIIGECLALLQSGKTERLVRSMVHAMVDTLLARPLGRLADIVPRGIQQGITEYCILTANRMFLQEVPGVVESLNIKGVVTDKVDSLDLLQLERLLLSIMEEQFKYINLFGAFLGFLLGLINLALVRLM